MKRLFISIVLVLLTAMEMAAQNVSFRAQAPSMVEVGEKFRIQYSINTQNVSNFNYPDFKMLAKGFRVEVRVGGAWKAVFADAANWRRLRQVAFDPVGADALRLVVTETWGGEKAHVFAVDAKSSAVAANR